eukprot:scaffold16558_cov89-Isochrysis_galbana.AAC.1
MKGGRKAVEGLGRQSSIARRGQRMRDGRGKGRQSSTSTLPAGETKPNDPRPTPITNLRLTSARRLNPNPILSHVPALVPHTKRQSQPTHPCRWQNNSGQCRRDRGPGQGGQRDRGQGRQGGQRDRGQGHGKPQLQPNPSSSPLPCCRGPNPTPHITN